MICAGKRAATPDSTAPARTTMPEWYRPPNPIGRGRACNPYLSDFLGMTDVRRERDLEQGIIDHIGEFLLELGQGSAATCGSFTPQYVIPARRGLRITLSVGRDDE